MNAEREMLGHVLLSALGAAMLLVFSFTGSALGRVLPYPEKALVGFTFIAFCVLGIVSSLKLVRFGMRKPASRTLEDEADLERRRRVGHHPDCDRFESHVVLIGTRRMCGGCLGLALGSSIALVSMAYYLSGGIIAPAHDPWLVLSGIVLVLLALVETAMRSRLAKVHVLANAILVIGFLLTTVGVSSATGSGAAGLFATMICLLFIDTRVRISEWKHANICQKCGRPCRSY